MKPFTQRRAHSVAFLGEEGLIAAIRRWLGAACPPAPFGIGDDCAVIGGTGKTQLLTVDPVIFGRHFDDRVPARAVGAKLLKRNLSDLAAMGGRPTAAVVALMLDPKVSAAWLEDFYRGLAACARRYGVPIVGGDISEAAGTLAASLTLLGVAAGPRAVTRAGAAPGDWIYVTGRLGGGVASGHHYRFLPRLAEGAWLAGRREVRAMMDLSDGLAKDVRALCPPRAEPAIQAGALPRRPRATVSAALCEGEDYELLLAVGGRADRPGFEGAWRRKFPRLALTGIGRFVEAGRLPADAIDLPAYRGYAHLGQ